MIYNNVMRARRIARHLLSVVGFAARLGVVIVLVLDLTPTSQRIADWVAAGQQAMQRGEYEPAVTLYSRLLAFPTLRTAGYQRLVDASLATDRYHMAQVYLYTLVDLDGWTPERRATYQRILDHTRPDTPAWAFAAPAQPPDTSDPRALRQLARQHIDQLAWDEAAQVLVRWLEVDPGDTEAAYWLGLLLAPQDRAQAVRYLEQAATDTRWAEQAGVVLAALAEFEGYPETDAQTLLGMALIEIEAWPFAEQAFQAALAVNAVNPTALAYLGFVRDQQGRDGLPDLQAALAMAPADPTVYYLLGRHWRGVQDHQAAYEAFVQARRLDPDNPALAVEIGKSLHILGKPDEAAEWYRIAVSLAPGDVRWQRILAAFYADTEYKLDEEGLAFIQQASENAPQDADIRTSLGWAYYRTGDTDRAYEQLNIALGMTPDSPRTLYYLGRVLETMGNDASAASAYMSAIGEAGRDSGYGQLASEALDKVTGGLE